MQKKTILLVVVFIGVFFMAQIAWSTVITWHPSKRLTYNSGKSWGSKVVVDSTDNIHMIWMDDVSGNDEIYYKKSTDGGLTWSAKKRLTWRSQMYLWPDLAIGTGDTLHLVWYDGLSGTNQVYYKRSTDGGSTWSGTKRLTWTADYLEGPAIAAGSINDVHIVWCRYLTPGTAIYYRRSTDGGVTWLKPQMLAQSVANATAPDIAVDSSGNILAVWQDNATGVRQIYCRQSSDSGLNWGKIKRRTWTATDSKFPIIKVDSNNRFFLLWRVNRTDSGQDIYYRSTTDVGNTWSVVKRLTWTAVDSTQPQIAVDSFGVIHLTWLEWNFGSVEDIFYKFSSDNGVTWGGTQRITWVNNMPWYSNLVVDSNDWLHLIWSHGKTGNMEIYYKVRK